jgi:ParB family transcriptional regulator, chromosome partitioning protein
VSVTKRSGPQRSGLGRGLDALLPKIDRGGVEQVNLEQLQVSPYQPRKRMDPEAIAELSASIAEKGVLQPLLVRPSDTGYEIVAGERRFRAAKQAGLTTVPVIVKNLSDQETLEIAIIENLQREDLNAVEEAMAFKKLMEFGLNQEDVAKAVGKSRSAVANTLRLLQLSDTALNALADERLSAGHARAILAQPEGDQDWALQHILENNLNVRQAEELKRPEFTPLVPKGDMPKIHEGMYGQLEQDLARHIGSKVLIKGKDKGRLELHFHSREELERLLGILGYQA